MYLIAYLTKISLKLDRILYKNDSLEYFTHRLNLYVRSLSSVKFRNDPTTKALCTWSQDFNSGSFVIC